MMGNTKWFIVAVIIGFIVAATIKGDGEVVVQCMLPFIAMFMILGLFVFVGLLVDPKGTIAMLKSVKSDWNDILSDD